MKFWTLWIIDAMVAAVFVYFFLVGLADGSVSSFNIALWVGILSGLGIILGCSLWLKSKNSLAAIILLLVLAIPAVLALLFLIVILISNPRWN